MQATEAMEDSYKSPVVEQLVEQYPESPSGAIKV